MKTNLRRPLRRMMSIAIALMLLGGDAWAQTVQVRLGQNMRLKKRGVLVSDAVIPAGTILEVSLKNYNAPVAMPSWRKDREAQDEFVRGIRIVKAPGFSARDVEELNASFGGSRGLFMRKSVIDDAVVVSVKKEEMRLQTNRPSDVYRRHTPDPIEEARSRRLTRDDARDLVEQIDEANRAARDAGNGASCRKFQSRWVQAGVPARALEKALQMYERNPHNRITNKRYITIADFTKHSGRKRMFLLDTRTGKVEKFYTSHGDGNRRWVNQGQAPRSAFSGKVSSHLTPPGFHVTDDEPFFSRRTKRSLRLHGLEERNKFSSDLNPNGVARRGGTDRRIYIHEAWYAADSFVGSAGYTGRSNGCLTLDPAKVNAFFKKVQGGSLVYNYVGD